jgi:hypothetical protein
MNASGAAEPDLTTIEGLMREVYQIISGPAGPRDWDRERQLFLPGAALMPAGYGPAGGTGGVIFDVEGYIASRTPFFEKTAFWEVETARREFVFGDKAHVLSAYEGRPTPDGPAFLRGINGLQLWNDGRRWWIASIVWDNERPGSSLPPV